jgi:hypothetical protein
MKDIALQINEDKRRKEQVVAVQATVDGWSGIALSVVCSELFAQGLVKKHSGSRCAERHLFLLDNLLFFTKPKSSGGRFTLAGAGMVFTDGCRFASVADGECVAAPCSLLLVVSHQTCFVGLACTPNVQRGIVHACHLHARAHLHFSGVEVGGCALAHVSWVCVCACLGCGQGVCSVLGAVPLALWCHCVILMPSENLSECRP